jgi:hypothetical protein
MKLKVSEKHQYTVAGVFTDFPENSHLKGNCIYKHYPADEANAYEYSFSDFFSGGYGFVVMNDGGDFKPIVETLL